MSNNIGMKKDIKKDLKQNKTLRNEIILFTRDEIAILQTLDLISFNRFNPFKYRFYKQIDWLTRLFVPTLMDIHESCIYMC